MSELQEELGLSNRTYFKKKFVEPLLTSSLLKMTKTDKPTARDQKYVVTDSGMQLMLAWQSNKGFFDARYLESSNPNK